MGRHKRKKTAKKPYTSANKMSTKTFDINEKIKNESAQSKLLTLQQANKRLRFEQIENTIWHALYISGIVAFGLFLLVVFALIVWCIILYCIGNNTVANTVITIIQLITGILSLGVGIWALVLTIKSNSNSTQILMRNMNINTSSANKDARALLQENDVNIESLE